MNKPIDTEMYHIDMSDKVFLNEDEISEGDLLLVDDVEEKLGSVLKETNSLIPYFSFDRDNRLECFIHPINKYMISKKEDYKVKKEICKTMGEHMEQFKFRNQSVDKLSQ